MGLAIYNKPFLAVDNTNKNNLVVINGQGSQNKEVKKVNSISKIKPKGDIELKNIHYRFTDKRYIGRKQINNKLITVYANTQKECAEKLKDAISHFLCGGQTKTKSSAVTFVKYWDKWFEENKKPFITKDTAEQIERVKRRTESIHNLPIKSINKDILLKLLNSIEEGRPKERVILYLKACFKTAWLDGTIKANPFANIVVKPRELKRKKPFTYDQQVAILERLKDEEIKPIILIYLITGLRRREFDYKNIDNNLYPDDRVLRAVNLKGRNQIVRYKEIQLSKEGFSLIKNNIELIKKFNDEDVYRKFAEILKELGIEGSIVTLRHTFATNNFYLGNPELFISRQMGHRTSQITKDNYTDLDYHLNKEKLLKLYNNLYYIF